ncbi:hypothetical protein [Pseudonocardia humida]|uniref:Uncharacterized protein n=1 Tax=Pseudonocardia humida TaxID=2800819 RepID=A0ABT0ZUM7_9PSEU|nr:hypothetical protein [Pseudonocardia humida]MCO1654436.1 hypothetical protein [Pseudonocardia humida]
MLPTLNGRIQTRIAMLVVVGGLWTLLLTPLLPLPGPLGEAYAMTFTILLTTLVLGVAWEFLYHLIMQFRWEKDWPTGLSLITVVNEGALVWLLLSLDAVPGLDGPSVPFGAFALLFLTTWLVVWLLAVGPMRVPFIHWRFRGGRLV